MAVPATVVYFTTYEQIKVGLGHSYNTPVNTWWVPVLAGSSARSNYVKNKFLCLSFNFDSLSWIISLLYFIHILMFIEIFFG
jgi:hypothetical protein